MNKTTVNLDEAKTHLSRLVDRAASGEDVTIARSGKPVARLTRLQPPKRSIRFGVLKGKVGVARGFDAPLPESVLNECEGR